MISRSKLTSNGMRFKLYQTKGWFTMIHVETVKLYTRGCSEQTDTNDETLSGA